MNYLFIGKRGLFRMDLDRAESPIRTYHEDHKRDFHTGEAYYYAHLSSGILKPVLDRIYAERGVNLGEASWQVFIFLNGARERIGAIFNPLRTAPANALAEARILTAPTLTDGRPLQIPPVAEAEKQVLLADWKRLQQKSDDLMAEKTRKVIAQCAVGGLW